MIDHHAGHLLYLVDSSSAIEDNPDHWLGHAYIEDDTWHIDKLLYKEVYKYNNKITGAAMTIDNLDRIHVSYIHHKPNPVTLEYMIFDGLEWKSTTLQSSLLNGADRVSIAVDMQNNPHISYNYGDYLVDVALHGERVDARPDP